jgi:hypothetical protein
MIPDATTARRFPRRGRYRHRATNNRIVPQDVKNQILELIFAYGNLENKLRCWGMNASINIFRSNNVRLTGIQRRKCGCAGKIV